MSDSRIPSPARSLGAPPVTPRRYKSRTRSVGSPARSTTTGRLSALVQFKDKDSFVLSPVPSRRSVLNDDTDIEEPRRRSWWKKIADNSRDVMEVLNDNKILETNEAVEEYIDIEVLSQEKKNYSIDIPDSSDSESISSIVIPQRKLFTQKEQPQNKFGQFVGTRETLAKLHKSQAVDKTVHVSPKKLFGHSSKPRTKPVFPAELLSVSPNKTVNKTKENVAAEVKEQVRNLFGNRAGTKRKNMFANFIVSESEDEISEIQPRVFEFPKKSDTRRESENSRGKREHSPTSSVLTDIEMDDWQMLPSSTMVENQLEDMMVAGKTPVKRARLSKLTETKELKTTTADPIEKEPSDEEQELKYSDDDKSEQGHHQQLQNQPELENVEVLDPYVEEGTKGSNRSNHENNEQVQNISKRNQKSKNDSQQKNTTNQNVNVSQHNATQDKEELHEEPMEVEFEQEQNRSKVHVENKILKESQLVRKENDKTKNPSESIEHDEHEMPQTEQLQTVDKTIEKNDNAAEQEHHEVYEEMVVEHYEKSNQSLEKADGVTDAKQNQSKIYKSDPHDNKDANKSHTEIKTKNDSRNKNVAETSTTSAVEEELQEIAQENSEVENESEAEDQAGEMSNQNDSNNEDQSENEQDVNESKINEQNEESEEIANDQESEADHNESKTEAQNDSCVRNHDESLDKSHNGSATDALNESAAEIQESSQEIADDEVPQSDKEENEAENDSEIENDNESEVEIQNESDEVQDNSDDNAQNDSDEEQEKINSTQNESLEVENEPKNESSEVEDMEDDAQNESEMHETEGDSQNESPETDEESEDKVQNSNDQPQSEMEHESNVTHDTTGRNRKRHEKVNSPEAIRHGNTKDLESFTAQGRNTSSRKTTVLKNLDIKPSLAPPRESTGLSDGTGNSSAEGSGWDSHRTTRKTLRQTFGKDFTPRKSLRALVMEKSAKRQTAMADMTTGTSKFPQANSTELPEASMAPDDVDISNESNHDVSKRTRQATLEMCMEKIMKRNMEMRLKMEEVVRNSLQAPTRDVLNPFKKPTLPSRKPNKVASKPKAKPVKSTLIPLDNLPDEFIKDMKYKPPKRFQPSNASWITKRLYKFLESKLEPQYDYKARVRAEKLVESIYYFCKDLRRLKVAPPPAVDALKYEMARLNIVKTHFEFNQFFHEFMPREVRIKVVPDIVNKIDMPRHGIFSDIIRGNTVRE